MFQGRRSTRVNMSMRGASMTYVLEYEMSQGTETHEVVVTEARDTSKCGTCELWEKLSGGELTKCQDHEWLEEVR